MRRWFLTIVPLALLSAAQAQDLPAGQGKEVADRVCGGCHEPSVVTKYRNSKDDWQSIAEDMKARGADGSEDDFKTIVTYLTRFFGPEVNVNKAAANEIETQLELTSSEAEAIVKYRQEKGSFKIFADLKHVPGLDVKKIEPIQQRIVFN
jgi:competence ComEA-like helix-hairpin-helix protein